MKYEYATRDSAKVDGAKQALLDQAARNGHSILGFVVTETDQDKRLPKGVMHWIVCGYTTQSELDKAQAAND